MKTKITNTTNKQLTKNEEGERVTINNKNNKQTNKQQTRTEQGEEIPMITKTTHKPT